MNSVFFSEASKKQEKLKEELYEKRRLAMAAVRLIKNINSASKIWVKASIYFLVRLIARTHERNGIKDY